MSAVPVRPLDDFAFGGEGATLLRINVGGGEVEALAGAAALLRNPALQAVLLEVSPARWER